MWIMSTLWAKSMMTIITTANIIRAITMGTTTMM